MSRPDDDGPATRPVPPSGPVSPAQLQAALGGELRGDGELPIRRIAAVADAAPDEISFVQARYRAQIATTRAGCLIVPPALADEAAARGAVIVTPDPYLYFARLTQWWAARFRPAPMPGVHPSAVVADDAVLGAGVSVGAQAVVESGAVLGDGVVVGALGFVGAGVVIGAGSRLAPRVTLMPGTLLGERCILHSGVVIGADGFGFAPLQGRWEKIEQLGGVRIGDDVEIGANTCIDRGALEDTQIGTGVKLDNLIQVAHNVQIGDHSAMAGCVGIAGSTRIGKGCTVGGAGMITGHIEIADGVHISAGTLVARSIREPGQYTGVFPLAEHATWEKNAATLRQLHALRDRVRALEKELKNK